MNSRERHHQQETIEVRLVLRGSRADVNALLGIAMEQGLLRSMQATTSVPSPRPERKRSKSGGGHLFNPGECVIVVENRKDYGDEIRKGRVGSVVTSGRYGRGVGVEVRWVDDPATTTHVPSSVLRSHHGKKA